MNKKLKECLTQQVNVFMGKVEQAAIDMVGTDDPKVFERDVARVTNPAWGYGIEYWTYCGKPFMKVTCRPEKVAVEPVTKEECQMFKVRK